MRCQKPSWGLLFWVTWVRKAPGSTDRPGRSQGAALEGFREGVGCNVPLIRMVRVSVSEPAPLVAVMLDGIDSRRIRAFPKSSRSRY